jgi:cytochrome b
MPAAPDADTRRALVWDAPVRVFHWLLALSFAGAWLSSEGDAWRPLHLTLGYTVGGLVVFRLAWGLLGTQHARFSSFVRSPAAAWRYLGGLRRGLPEHHVGHNPAGGWAIVAMLGLAALSVGTGWAHWNEQGGPWLEQVHELSGNALLLLVVLHVAAVLLTSRLHGENLVRSMVDGLKRGQPTAGIRRTGWPLGGLLLVAVLGFWGRQWVAAPELRQEVAAHSAHAHAGPAHGHDAEHEDEDEEKD